MNGRLVLLLSIVLLAGQLQAMDGGSSSQAPNQAQGSVRPLPDESSGSSSQAVQQPQVQEPKQILITTRDGKEVLAPDHVLIRTSDGLETWVPINEARLFGSIREKIEDALSSEPIEFQFMGEDITLPASRIEDGIDVMSVTKPELDQLLENLHFVFYPHGTRNPEDILRLSDYERKNTFKSRERGEPFFTPDQLRNIERLLRDRLALLQLAYDLDMPELTNYYAVRVINVLLDFYVLRMLRNGEYNLLNIVLELPDKLKNEINEKLNIRDVRAVLGSSIMGRRIELGVKPLSISSDTIEKNLFIRVLLEAQVMEILKEELPRMLLPVRNEDDSLTITPWVHEMWNSLSDKEKSILREEAPEVVMQIEPKKTKRAIPLPEEPVALPEESSALSQPPVRSIRPHFKQVVYPDFE